MNHIIRTIFDDIANQFDGSENEFDLKVDRSDVVGISSANGVVLINGMFKLGMPEEYAFDENSGILQNLLVQHLLLVMILVSQYPRGGISFLLVLKGLVINRWYLLEELRLYLD